MKKSILLGLVLVSLFACQSVEQYRTGIEELGTKWDTATVAVTNFSSKLQTEQASFVDMTGKMAVDQAIFTSLKPEVQEQINSSKNACNSAGSGYSDLIQKVNGFASDWTTKGSELTMLKDGLAAGKLDGDVMAKVGELNSYITSSQEQLGAFQNQFDSIKKSCADSHSKWSSLIASATTTAKK